MEAASVDKHPKTKKSASRSSSPRCTQAASSRRETTDRRRPPGVSASVVNALSKLRAAVKRATGTWGSVSAGCANRRRQEVRRRARLGTSFFFRPDTVFQRLIRRGRHQGTKPGLELSAQGRRISRGQATGRRRSGTRKVWWTISGRSLSARGDAVTTRVRLTRGTTRHRLTSRCGKDEERRKRRLPASTLNCVNGIPTGSGP